MSSAKRVFITGTSAGFGHDVALALARRGHTVYATMRGATGKNAAAAKRMESEGKSGGGSIRVLELDVTDEKAVATAVEAATREGPIDVVVNNAGVGTMGIDEGFTVAQAEQVFATNLFGVMRVNHAFLPHLRQAGKGRIIYVTSGLGRLVFPFMGIYQASKFALEAYAQSVSYELAPLGIESLILQPGAYGTAFGAKSVFPANDKSSVYGPTAEKARAFASGFEQMAKAGHLGQPTEVVDALVEEVERPAGPHPLRRTVGRDVLEPVTAINRVCDEVQARLLAAFHLT